MTFACWMAGSEAGPGKEKRCSLSRLRKKGERGKLSFDCYITTTTSAMS